MKANRLRAPAAMVAGRATGGIAAAAVLLLTVVIMVAAGNEKENY